MIKVNFTNTQPQVPTKRIANHSFALVRNHLLQRKSNYRSRIVPTGEGEESRRTAIQARTNSRRSQSVESEVPPIVHEVLRTPSEPLDPATRAFMEPRFGHDFSEVRIHTGSHPAASARLLHALAFTVGHDVVFGAGQYAPQSSAGQRLLAHELTHVVQQGTSGVIHRQTNQDPAEDVPTANNPTPEAAAPDQEQAPEQDETDVEPEGQSEEAEDSYESLCVASDSEDTMQSAETEPKVAAKPEPAISPGLISRIVSPDHSSEREADAVSQAVISSPPFKTVPHISRSESNLIQRKILWDGHPTLGWADFQGPPDNSSKFDAATDSGFSESWKPQVRAVPDNPVSPTPCIVRGKKTTKFAATVSLDISPENLHAKAFMEEKNSWVKAGKKTDSLLSHEQGHFDISHVMAGKTDWALTMWGIQNLGKGEGCGERAAKSAAAGSWNKLNPTKTLDDVIKKGLALNKQAQKDYDDQTQHGLVTSKQTEWKGNIVADLPAYDIK